MKRLSKSLFVVSVNKNFDSTILAKFPTEIEAINYSKKLLLNKNEYLHIYDENNRFQIKHQHRSLYEHFIRPYRTYQSINHFFNINKQYQNDTIIKMVWKGYFTKK